MFDAGNLRYTVVHLHQSKYRMRHRTPSSRSIEDGDKDDAEGYQRGNWSVST